MISTLEKEITLRFLKARKKDGFLNVISIFSFIGISLGVAVLIIVMSVMNGFRTELINKIVGFNAHITVKSYETTIDNNNFKNKDLKLISKNLILSNSSEGIIIGEKKHDNVKGSTLILLTKGEELKIKSKLNSKFLLISGKPINEEIARGGPFVMNTKSEILEAVNDYHNGTFVK